MGKGAFHRLQSSRSAATLHIMACVGQIFLKFDAISSPGGCGFFVWPVTQRGHPDPYSQDDESQEEEEARGRVEAEPAPHHHHISAPLPLSK